MRLFIIDTGSANLNSVKQAFKRIGADAVISSDVTELKTADKLVLPGVGTACAVMEGIDKYNLASFIFVNCGGLPRSAQNYNSICSAAYLTVYKLSK